MQKHWSVDETRLAEDPEAHAVWKLEQRINYGIGEQLIPEQELRARFETLDLDPWKRKALALALA